LTNWQLARPGLPGSRAPDLDAPLVGGGHWRLHDELAGTTYTLVIFYRGLFCNVCSRYLPEVVGLRASLQERNVPLIFLSADNEERATRARDDWELGDVKIGYGLQPAQLAAWGLFLSEADPGRPMPPVFCEPGLFLVKPDGTLFYAALNSAPFARPRASDILDAIDFIASRGGEYPQRGSVLAPDPSA
jgi:peroxiredoxin